MIVIVIITVVCLLLINRGSTTSLISIPEEIELFQRELSEPIAESSIPNLISLTFQHQHFFRPYSFNEWDWLSFHQLLRTSVHLCQENRTFASLWTLPIKCEYYLVIRALRKAKDNERLLNHLENQIITQYIDNIYGKKEDYERVKKKLSSSILDESKEKEVFQLKTILESNGVLQLLDSPLIATEEILEFCTKSVLEEATNNSSIAFLFRLPNSYFELFYSDLSDTEVFPNGALNSFPTIRMTNLPFFQLFIRSFLRAQELQDSLTGPQKMNFDFTLYVAYDSIVAEKYPSEFLSRFRDLCKGLLSVFKEVELVGLAEELHSSYDHSSATFYNYQRIIDQGQTSLYFFPQVFRRLISSSRQSYPDYFFFIKDTYSLGDASSFGKSLSSLRYRNHLVPNFGLSLDLHRQNNDLIVFHKDLLSLIESFPLSANVLNNSYLNDPDEEITWNHMYFTLIDIFSVFQPSLRNKNEFLLSRRLNYSLVYDLVNFEQNYVNAQFVSSIERYKVLVERARRHLAKKLHTDENYIHYHSCINDEVNRRKTGQGKGEFHHPVQFYWRPNQLLYEVNGLFSPIRF